MAGQLERLVVGPLEAVEPAEGSVDQRCALPWAEWEEGACLRVVMT